MFYSIATSFLKIFYHILFKIEVDGNENLPKEGPVIVCANHRSYYDAPAVAIFLKRPLNFMAKKELFEHKLLAPIIRALHAFPVDRSEAADLTSFKTGMKILKKGEVMGIFIEGKIVRNNDAVAAKMGAALFALKSNAIILPAAISSTYKPFSKLVVHYGKPISLNEYKGKRVTKEVLNEVTDLIMKNIESLKVEL